MFVHRIFLALMTCCWSKGAINDIGRLSEDDFIEETQLLVDHVVLWACGVDTEVVEIVVKVEV